LGIRSNPPDRGGMEAGFYAQHGCSRRFTGQGCCRRQQQGKEEGKVFHGMFSCRGIPLWMPGGNALE
jgi:hypothetical protein